jgi:hypothetical protein
VEGMVDDYKRTGYGELRLDIENHGVDLGNMWNMTRPRHEGNQCLKAVGMGVMLFPGSLVGVFCSSKYCVCGGGNEACACWRMKSFQLISLLTITFSASELTLRKEHNAISSQTEYELWLE